MPIDSSIYARFAPQVKSVQDYENEYMRGQANQLALLGAQGEYQDKQRARQEAEALKGVVSGFGQDQAANYRALLRGGFLKPAQEYQKNALDIGKIQAETQRAQATADKERIATQKTRMETILNAASSARDPASYAQVRNMLAMQGFDVSSIPEQFDPSFVENARRAAMTEVQRLEQEWKAKGYELDVFKAGETQRHNRTTEGLTAQGQQITLRGQNLTDARARESNATQKELANASKELQIQKQQMDIDEKVQRKASDVSNMERSAQLIDMALSHPGRAAGTGLSSVADPRNFIPGTDAKNFGVVVDQLKGRAFLQAFESLKGGGQITEVEGRKATEAIARLSTAQSDDEFVTSLKDLRDVVAAGYKRATGKDLGAPSGASGSWGGRSSSGKVVNFGDLK